VKIRLDYGKSDLEIHLPDNLNIDVLESRYIQGLPEPSIAIEEALRNPVASGPLREIVGASDRVCIVVNDITRATPYDIILPSLLGQLNHIDEKQITLLAACGTHRENTYDELCSTLGRNVVDKYRIVQNNANDRDSHAFVGKTNSGNDVWLHKEYLDCDLRILTGFIEPHFFAGFSGGGKACLPGMALLDTILKNHCPQNIDHPKASWGITQGNPVWEEIQEAVEMCGPSFLVNVSMNRDKKITGVFAGDTRQAHERGCAFVRENAMLPVRAPYDIVITSNSGYPLDLNLYQSVKGMSAGVQIVKDKGAIIIAADCWDGIPDHGEFKRLLFEADSPSSLLKHIRTQSVLLQDTWQAQILARICEKSDVYLFSSSLSDDEITKSMLNPCRDIRGTVESLIASYGTDASFCVLPEGPLTIPYISSTI
jgi:nickel-dependent lactate racemase